MSQAANVKESDRSVSQQAAEGDILPFLRRTLQFHSSDPQRADVSAKLQNLSNALDQQEAKLSTRPDSPSKERIRVSLAKAKKLIAEVIDGFGGA